MDIIYKTLTNNKGVELKTAQAIIAYLPELGKVDNENIINICGLTPINQDNDTINNNVNITNEKKEVRDILYHITTLSTKECDRYYEAKLDLLDENKSGEQAIYILTKRFITELNNDVRDRLKENGF